MRQPQRLTGFAFARWHWPVDPRAGNKLWFKSLLRRRCCGLLASFCGGFSLSSAPAKKARAINMLEKSLSQLETLVNELLQANQALLSSNAQLSAELARVRDENDNLQLSALEQDELQNATVARIQALVERATVSNSVNSSPACA
jgi:hypothetical protein